MAQMRALFVVPLLAACLEPRIDGPSDAGLPSTATLTTPHAPCTQQEGGLQAAALDCQAINIVETSITTVVGGMPATAQIAQLTPTPTSLVSANVTGPFTFADVACPGATVCTFGPQALPYMLGVQCTAAGTGILSVRGTNGMMDTDSAVLTCLAPGPTINVTPSTITPPLLSPVGVPVIAPQQITVTNNGTGTLSYTVINADPGQWQLVNGTCTGFPSCMLPGGGATHTFDVQFTPSTHHAMPVVNTFTFDGGAAGMPTVQASGSGTGAVLSVMPTSHDFLQLAKGTLGTQTITVTNTGNVPMNVSLVPPSSPFGTSAAALANIMPNESRMFDATCQAQAATGPQAGAILLMSDAYLPAGGMQNITLQCEVLDTDVQVMPNPIAFGEVKKGSADRTIDVTLTNASPVTEKVASVAIVDGPPALSRSGFSSGDIAGSSSRTVTVKLSTATEVDLANARLEVQLVGQPTPLAVPIQGKVVVPSARVMPESLDLGTACIGSAVHGLVTLVNDGSATLTAERPTMDEAFVAQSPSAFPVTLPEGQLITVDVSPAMMNAGNASGVLSWSVGALGEPLRTFTVPVELTYIPTGTAVSPAKLDFGRLDVSLVSATSTVTLRNCDPEPVTVHVDGLAAERGPLDAWQIDPAMIERTLASQETLTIAARFLPKRAGLHRAKVVLRVGDEQRFIELFGEGLGPALDKASLYACDCSSSRPLGAWPIVLALLIVLRRRVSTCSAGRSASRSRGSRRTAASESHRRRARTRSGDSRSGTRTPRRRGTRSRSPRPAR